MDNAIEGCQASPLSGKKEVHLTIKTQGNILLIIVENSISRKIDIGKNLFIPTTKADKQLHGIGLKSISNFVKKYDGDFQLNSTDDKFTASVMLPVAEIIQ